MKTRILLGFAALLTFAATPARADPSARYFLDLLNKDAETKAIATIALGSYFSAYLWANAYIETHKGAKMYCQPRSMALLDEQGIDILQRHVKANPDDADLPVGMTIIKAFSAAFPCS